MHEEAVRALVDALRALDVTVETPNTDDGPDLVIEGVGGGVVAEVKAVSVADPARVARLIEARRPLSSGESTIAVLVADEITEATRQLLRREGWGYLDRRGRLWFSAPLAERQRRAELASDRELTRRVGHRLVEDGLIPRLTPEIERRLDVHWQSAGTMLSLALRTTPMLDNDLVAELRALVAHFATRY